MTVGTEGDVGDAVVLCGVMQHIPGGPHKLLFQPSSVTKTGADPSKLCDIVAPLAQIQSYISEARCVQPNEPVDWHSGQFRGRGMWCPQTSLLGAKANWLHMAKGIKVDAGKQKWLHHITPHPYAKDRVIINRTGRYRNHYFPWTEIVHYYGDRLLFVGLPHEYRDFCGEFGLIERFKTENMLDVAELIHGSLLFIGNQSSPNAVAEGLKHPLIQETSLHIPDCIFPRSDAQHVSDGSCILPGFDGDEPRVIPSKMVMKLNINESIVPPGGWQFPGVPSQGLPSIVVSLLQAQRGGGDKAQIREEVIAYNVARLPGYFDDNSTIHSLDVFKEAMRNALH